MTLSITTVKREIRILGLDCCKKGEALGAVVRGGFFLDGVARFSQPGSRADFHIGRRILATRFYPELRIIMLHDQNGRLNPRLLEKHSRLPVIEVADAKQPGSGYTRFRSKRGSLSYRTGLPVQVAEKILSLSWTHIGLPEPVRIAHLLSRDFIICQ